MRSLQRKVSVLLRTQSTTHPSGIQWKLLLIFHGKPFELPLPTRSGPYMYIQNRRRHCRHAIASIRCEVKRAHL